jgi:hypothetical protein
VACDPRGGIRRFLFRHRHWFDTHWQFVRFAQENGLNLDFTTPPRPPPATLPPLFGP